MASLRFPEIVHSNGESEMCLSWHPLRTKDDRLFLVCTETRSVYTVSVIRDEASFVGTLPPWYEPTNGRDVSQWWIGYNAYRRR
jgi:hypothetical protein